MLGGLAQVHLQSGRVKEKDSLIEKVIRKRYEYIGSKTSAYAHLRGVIMPRSSRIWSESS